MPIQIRRNSTTGSIPVTNNTVVGEILGNTFDQKLFLRGNNGSDLVTPVGGSGFLIKNVQWSPATAATALESFEYGQRVFLFAAGQGEAILAWIRVPQGYTPGSQILLKLLLYSPSSSNNVKVQTTTTLTRKNTDALTSVANQRGSTNGDLALSTALVPREVSLDLTDSAGAVNGVTVNPGDMLQILLTRTTPSGTEDTTNDLRVIADAAEVVFN